MANLIGQIDAIVQRGVSAKRNVGKWPKPFLRFLWSLSESFLCFCTNNMLYEFWRTRCFFLHRRHSCSINSRIFLFLPDFVFQVCVGTHMACKMDDRSTVELLFEVRRVSNELALI